MEKIDIVVAGHICIDITPKFNQNIAGKTIDELFIGGKLINVEEAVVSTGGAVSNTGIPCIKLGAKIALMAKVGDDIFGQGILSILKRYRADISGMSIVKGENSSYSIVISVPGIDRIFLHNPGANNTFEYKDINLEVVKKAKMFHFGYPTLMKKLYVNDGEELVKIFRKIKEYGIITSLDMTLPDPDSESGKINWDKILKKTLPYVDIFLPSFEEILYMIDKQKYWKLKKMAGKNIDINELFTGDDLTRISDKLLSYKTKIVVIKCSKRGIYIRTGKLNDLNIKNTKIKIDTWQNRELWSSTYKAKKIFSATGSGDSAIAGFLIAFLKGENIETAIKCANSVGWQNLRAYDAISGIGNWKETISMVKNKNIEMNSLQPNSPNWKYSEQEMVWEKQK